MRLHFARFGYGFLERSVVSVMQAAMSLTQYRRALTASTPLSKRFALRKQAMETIGNKTVVLFPIVPISPC